VSGSVFIEALATLLCKPILFCLSFKVNFSFTS
jgi:hypothetical protein